MATTLQEEVYWTNGEVWVTDRRVVFVDKHYMLDKINEVSIGTSTFEQRLGRIIGILPIIGIVGVIDWLALRAQAGDRMQSFVDWLFIIIFAGSTIGVVGLLLYFLRQPRGDIACIIIREGFVRRTVFVSTNQINAGQIVKEIKQALDRRGTNALINRERQTNAAVYTAYSEPGKVADNPNRVLMNGEWLISGEEEYKLDAIEVLKLVPVSVWPYWWS